MKHNGSRLVTERATPEVGLIFPYNLEKKFVFAVYFYYRSRSLKISFVDVYKLKKIDVPILRVHDD